MLFNIVECFYLKQNRLKMTQARKGWLFQLVIRAMARALLRTLYTFIH